MLVRDSLAFAPKTVQKSPESRVIGAESHGIGERFWQLGSVGRAALLDDTSIADPARFRAIPLRSRRFSALRSPDSVEFLVGTSCREVRKCTSREFLPRHGEDNQSNLALLGRAAIVAMTK